MIEESNTSIYAKVSDRYEFMFPSRATCCMCCEKCLRPRRRHVLSKDTEDMDVLSAEALGP